MNNIEPETSKQITFAQELGELNQDLQQAVKVINAEYQQIDWEDQIFLNRVLTRALSIFEAKGETNANN